MPDGFRWLAIAALAALLPAAACAGGAPGQAVRARFDAANQAYEAGDYDKAAGIYDEIAKSGIVSPALHYNLGNALFKSGHLGPAILQYERALKLDPGDTDSRDNLEYLRTLTVDKITPAPSPLTALGVPFLLGLTSPDEDALILVTCWILAGVAFGAGLLARGETLRRSAWYAAGALCVPALVFGAALAAKVWLADSGPHGIVLAPEVQVLSGAGKENPALFTVHEGLKVLIRARTEGWVQVSLANGLTGWLPGDAVEPI